MRVLLAPDKFKGSLDAMSVCAAMEKGLADVRGVTCIRMPLADGGDGTATVLSRATGGNLVRVPVSDPLGRRIVASYGISGDGKTAYIESAEASGLRLLHRGEYNPLNTSSAGTGELILDAVRRGVTGVMLGIGGTATNDGGMGLACALGFHFLDTHGRPLKPMGQSLSSIASVDDRLVNPEVRALKIVVLSDVDNPLLGPTGAAYTYALQKGAQPEDLPLLDHGLANFRDAVLKYAGYNIDQAGCGAGGGMAGGVCGLLRATIESGITQVMAHCRLEAVMRDCDLVITGEGKLDEQSLHGKVVAGVSGMAASLGKPVLVVCGRNTLTRNALAELGIAEVAELVGGDVTEADAIRFPERFIAIKTKEVLMGFRPSV